MGNWQERKRKLEEDEKRQLIEQKNKLKHESEAHNAQELESKRQKEIKIKDLRKKQQEIIKSLPIKELLKKVKNELWQCGDIKPVLSDGDSGVCVGYELRFNYRALDYPISGYNGTRDSGGSFTYGNPNIGWDSTAIEITADPESHWGEKDDYSINIAIHDWGNQTGWTVDPKKPDARSRIEECLWEDYVLRRENHSLPKELEAGAKKTIRENIPLTNRIFRRY